MTREEKTKAIDALKLSAPIKAVTQEEFNTYIQTINQVMDWLEQEPKTGHWIPVSERLPEKDEYVDDVCKYYLIQDEYGDMHVAHYSSIGWIPINSIKAIGDDVVAWMNLPENYKAESEE